MTSFQTMAAIVSVFKNKTIHRCISNHFAGQGHYMTIFCGDDHDAGWQSVEGSEKLLVKGARVILFDREFADQDADHLQKFCDSCDVRPILISLGEPQKIEPRYLVERPFKFGRLLDVLDASLNTTLDTIPVQEIDCAPFGAVDISQKIWRRKKENSEKEVSEKADMDSADNVALTDKEIMLLYILSQTQSGPLSKDMLYKSVWGFSNEMETHTLETHIYRLRQKIEPDSSSPQILKTYGDHYALFNKDSGKKTTR